MNGRKVSGQRVWVIWPCWIHLISLIKNTIIPRQSLVRRKTSNQLAPTNQLSIPTARKLADQSAETLRKRDQLVQEQDTVCMMAGTFAPKTRLIMKVSDVSGVKISIMCSEIVTNKHDRCSHLFSCYTFVIKIVLCTNAGNIKEKVHEYHTLVLFEIWIHILWVFKIWICIHAPPGFALRERFTSTNVTEVIIIFTPLPSLEWRSKVTDSGVTDGATRPIFPGEMLDLGKNFRTCSLFQYISNGKVHKFRK